MGGEKRTRNPDPARSYCVPSVRCRVSPDGNILASGGEDHAARLWDVRNGRELRESRGHTSMVWGVAFSPNGRTLASGSEHGKDGAIKLWETLSGNELLTLKGICREHGTLAFSPNGRFLASEDFEGNIKLWDAGQGYALQSFPGSRAVAFSPNGLHLASPGWDNNIGGTVKLWNLATGEEYRSLGGGQFVVRALAFSPDGHSWRHALG